MRIIINATNIRLGGSVQVACSILEELKAYPGNKYHVFLSPYLSGIVKQDAFPAFFHFYRFDSYPLSSLKNMFFFSGRLSKLETKIRPDFVFSVFGPTMWRPKAPHLSGFANVILFDEAPYTKKILLSSPLSTLKYKLRRYLTLRQIKNEADIYWLETELARNKLAEALSISKGKISVISNNFAAYFNNVEIIRPRHIGFRFLYLSSYYKHKNFEILNEVVPLLKARGIDCSFYLTLTPEDFATAFPALQNDPMLVNVGPVRPEDCPDLYNRVDAAFIPTYLEFFTAGYPEAMVMQRPILTSDLDFAHDICGNAALYFDPFDPESAVAAIEKLITDTQIKNDLIQIGLERLRSFDTAAQRAEKLLNTMKNYLDQNS